MRAALGLLCSHPILAVVLILVMLVCCSWAMLAVTLNGQAGPLNLHCPSLKQGELKRKGLPEETAFNQHP